MADREERTRDTKAPDGRPQAVPSEPPLLAPTPAQPVHAVGRRVIFGFLALAIAVILYLSYQVFRPFLQVFILAGATAILSYPIHERITRRLGGRPNLGAAATLFLLLLLLVVPVTFYSSLLSVEAANLTRGLNAATIQEYVQQATDRFLPERFDLIRFVKERLGPEGILGSDYFKGAVNEIASAANKLVQNFIAGTASALISLLFFFLFLFFLLRDGEKLGRELMQLSPLESRDEKEIFNHLTKTIRAILLGGVFVPIAQGFLSMVGFAVFGLPSPILWGSLLIVAAVIPIVGGTVVWIPAVIYMALSGSTWQWVGLLAYCILIVSTVDNILKPVILRAAANFHPMIAFVSVLGGMIAFGVFGFILGPVIASLLLSLLRIYKHEILKLPQTEPVA